MRRVLLIEDEALAVTLLTMFVQDIPVQIAKLKEAISTEDAAMIRSVAHFIKGVAANMCTPAINALAKEIEQAGARGTFERARMLFPRLESSWQAFLDHPKVIELTATVEQ